MNNVIETILSRKSCKCFDEAKEIKKEDIELIIKAAQYAPSAMNAQSWHFTVIHSKEKLDKLNTVVFDELDEAARIRIASRNGGGNFNFFYNAPVFVIVSCDAQKSPYPEADCSCALQNMFLAATSLKIGSCWINQLTHNSFNPKVREFLDSVGVPKNNKVYGCCALGYAKKESDAKKRAENTVNFV